MTEYNLHQIIIFSMSGMKFGISVSKSELEKIVNKKNMQNIVTSWGIAVLKFVQMIGKSFSESLEQKIKHQMENHVLKACDSTACKSMIQSLKC